MFFCVNETKFLCGEAWAESLKRVSTGLLWNLDGRLVHGFIRLQGTIDWWDFAKRAVYDFPFIILLRKLLVDCETSKQQVETWRDHCLQHV